MIDHITIAVTDIERAKAFYDASLGVLGLKRVFEGGTFAGYGGDSQRPYFWIGVRPTVATGTHVAFTAADRATVEAFHRAALASGGTDNGAPGLRPQYHAAYYGAFVLDPDGHNIEAVCHDPG